MSTDFSLTRMALEAYDNEVAWREVQWANATTDEEVKACQKMDEDALSRVRKSFARDTRGINSYDNAMMATIDFIRKTVL